MDTESQEWVAFLTLIFAAVGVLVTSAGVLVAATYTVLTFLLWKTTKKSLDLNTEATEQLANQVANQIALSHAASDHHITDSHRELFLSIFQNPKLLEIFARNSGMTESVLQRKYLGTFLINHCATVFYYHKRQILSSIHLESFANDARYLFSFPFIRDRWSEVQRYHPKVFQEFVEKFLLDDKEIQVVELEAAVYDSSLEPTPTERQ